MGKPKKAAKSAPFSEETKSHVSGKLPKPGVTSTDSKASVSGFSPIKKDFKSFIFVVKNSGPVVLEP